MKHQGLGRGLGSLIPAKKTTIDDISATPTDRVLQVQVDQISVNPYQPRSKFGEQEMTELMSSILEHGILQPLVVTRRKDGGYELVAGDRRLRAVKELNMKTVPVVVRETDDVEKLELSLVENIQRQDLNPIEKAAGYNKLIEEFSLSQAAAAKKLGVGEGTLRSSIRLLRLPEDIKEAIIRGDLTEGHARVIVGIPSEEEQRHYAEQVMRHKLTVRELEHIARKSRATRKANIDPFLMAMENRLRETLGSKVYIKRKGNKGKIEINFFSNEELQEIVDEIAEKP